MRVNKIVIVEGEAERYFDREFLPDEFGFCSKECYDVLDEMRKNGVECYVVSRYTEVGKCGNCEFYDSRGHYSLREDSDAVLCVMDMVEVAEENSCERWHPRYL